MLEATNIVVAVAKMYLAWHLFRQAWQQGRVGLHPADVAQLNRQVLAEVAKQKAVQA